MIAVTLIAAFALSAPAQSTEIHGRPADPLLGKIRGINVSWLRKQDEKAMGHFVMVGDAEFLSQEIPKRGGQVITKTKSVVTALLPIKQMLSLAETPKVYLAEYGSRANRMGRPSYAKEAPKITFCKKPLAEREYSIKTWPWADLRKAGVLGTGKGVIVGVIESDEVDFRHPDLRNDDGSTRFTKIWSQWIPDGKSPEGFPYGSEYDTAALNKVLSSNGNGGFPFGTMSDHATGSMTALAGNGNATGKYCGVAPEATLIGVANLISESTIVDGVAYIFKEADKEGKPCVVNISQTPSQLVGRSEDGSDPGSIALNELIGEKPGRVIVSSAGNNAQIDRHFHFKLDGTNTAQYVMRVIQPQPTALAHSIVYPGDSTLEVQMSLVETNGRSASEIVSSEWIPLSKLELGKAMTFDMLSDDAGYSVDVLPIWHNRGMKEAMFDIHIKGRSNRPTAIRWRYRGKGDVDGQCSVFVEIVDHIDGAEGYVSTDNLQRVSTPACAERVIAIGAYADTLESEYGLHNQAAAITDYSQPGGPFLGTYKPLLVGPTNFYAGVSIDSQELDDTKRTVEGAHQLHGGTSASGPAVAGAIALYLQSHPKATYLDVEKALIAACESDRATGETPNPKSGYGKLNLMKFLGPRKQSPKSQRSLLQMLMR